MDKKLLSQIFEENEQNFEDVFEMCPMLEFTSEKELNDIINIFVKYGVDRIDVSSFLYFRPDLFTWSVDEVDDYLKSKVSWCKENNCDFIEKIYGDLNFLLD